MKISKNNDKDSSDGFPCIFADMYNDFSNYWVMDPLMNWYSFENIENNENMTMLLDSQIDSAIEQYKYEGNVSRRRRFENLSSELQGVQQLFRKFNFI